MSGKIKYHSALKPELSDLDSISFFENDGNKVFVSDIAKKGVVSAEFEACDVFYSEPAWKDGYEKFLERAKTNSESYLNYIWRMAEFIYNTNKPVFLVVGSHAIPEFPTPHFIQKIKLHGYTTNLCVWNSEPLICGTNYEAIAQLALKYNCVGDFNAGYGNTARIFKENGKNFICSDINPKCIYYIAKTLMGYGK